MSLWNEAIGIFAVLEVLEVADTRWLQSQTDFENQLRKLILSHVLSFNYLIPSCIYLAKETEPLDMHTTGYFKILKTNRSFQHIFHQWEFYGVGKFSTPYKPCSHCFIRLCLARKAWEKSLVPLPGKNYWAHSKSRKTMESAKGAFSSELTNWYCIIFIEIHPTWSWTFSKAPVSFRY